MSSLKDKKSFKIELAVALVPTGVATGPAEVGERPLFALTGRLESTSNRAIRSLATKVCGPRDPQLAQVDATGLGAHSA